MGDVQHSGAKNKEKPRVEKCSQSQINWSSRQIPTLCYHTKLISVESARWIAIYYR
jgi:hypothetical protein